MELGLTTFVEEKQITPSTVYIDEAGDLGYQRGTQWFVLAAVVVDKTEETELRHKIEIVRERLNVREIHMRKLRDYNQRAFAVDVLADGTFTYIAVLVDTKKLNLTMRATASVAYNYICRMLLERVSWFLRDTQRVGDIVLSARGTARDEELIQYISEKLITVLIQELDLPKACLSESPRNLHLHGTCSNWRMYVQLPCFGRMKSTHGAFVHLALSIV